MAKARFINIVTTECSPEDDAKVNVWYNEVHIPMLLKYKGLKKAARYKIIDENKDKPKYVAVYEYDSKEAMTAVGGSPEFKAAIAEMDQTWKGKSFHITGALSCEPIKAWER
jgi:uncharacterized protein (TIGR02118 family)